MQVLRPIGYHQSIYHDILVENVLIILSDVVLFNLIQSFMMIVNFKLMVGGVKGRDRRDGLIDYLL